MRRWKRRLTAWLREDCFSGGRYVALVAEGRARAWDWGYATAELRRVMSDRALELLGHVVAASIGFGRNRGGIKLTYEQMTRLLPGNRQDGGCSKSSAEVAVRELVALGLVDQRHWFRRRLDSERVPRSREEVLGGSPKHHEVAPRYALTPAAWALVEECRTARRSPAGGYHALAVYLDREKNEPGRAQRPLRGLSSGVPARGRPGRSFVGAVLRARAAAIADAERSRVDDGIVSVTELRAGRMSLADGRVVEIPLITADTAAAELRRAGAPREAGRGTLEDAIGGAWAAFERTRGAQGGGGG